MYWIRFNDWCARHSGRGQIRDKDGIHAAWSHTLLLINNLTTPAGPLANAAELQARARAAVDDAARYGLPWMFGIPEPWLPMGLDEANATLHETGLQPMIYMTAMRCGVPLSAPARPLPAGVEVRRVNSRALQHAALDLNSRAYGMPPAITEDVLAAGVYFTDPTREWGFVVYKNGVPVSTATAIDLDETVYIAAVATDAEHRQNGYAELAMRKALEAAPRKPTTLDASRMGQPLYAQMGYCSEFRWQFWTPAERLHK